MNDHIDQDEARRLIETALSDIGGEDLAGLVDRAEGSTVAFVEAAEAYARDDLVASAVALEHYVHSAESLDRGAFDLCVAGAAKVAFLFADIRSHDPEGECDGSLRLDPEGAPNVFIRTAIQLANAAADRRPDDVGELLVLVHGFAGADGLGILATSLVDTYTHVSRMVAELD